MGFLRGFSIAIGANAVLFILSFLNNKLLYMELSREENGIYFLVLRFSMLVGLIFNEWMRITNMNIAGKDKSLTPFLASNSIFNALLSSILLYTLVFMFPSTALYLFPGIPAEFVVMIILVGFCFMLKDSFQALLLVNNRLKFYGLTIIIWGIVLLLLNIIFITVLHCRTFYVLIALLIASLVSALWATSGIAIFNGIASRPSLAVLKKSARIGVRVAFAVLGMFLMINIHAFTLSPLSGNPAAGLIAVGVFSVGFRIFQLYQRGADVASTILYSHVTQGSENSGKWMTLLVFRNIFFFSFVFTIIGGILGKYIIFIVADSTYYDALKTLIFMIPGIVFFNAGSVINGYYWASGYPIKVIIAPFVATVAGLFLDYLLVPSLGPEGASISFSASATIWFIYILLIFKLDTGHKVSTILLPNKEDYIYLKNKIKTRFDF